MITKNRYIPSTIFSMLILGFCLASFSSPWTRDIFYICGYLCIIYVILNLFNKEEKNNKYISLLIPCSLLVFGTARLILAVYFQQHDHELDSIYYAYKSTSKRLIIGSFIVYAVFLSRSQLKILSQSRLIRTLLQLLPIIILGYALYQFSIIGMERIDLSTNRATATAYIITPIFLISLYLCLKQVNNSKYILLVLTNLCASVITILLTQTRSAILIYLVLSLIMTLFMLCNRVSWKYIAAVIATFMVIMILSYRPIIKPRMIAALQETENYNVATASGSFNSRFAMWQAGIYVFEHHPMGQSAGSRYTLIKDAVEHKEFSSFIMQFINVHLHNEIIETLSLQGLWGTLLLVFVYLSLLLTSLIQRNPLLFLCTLSLIGFGLSDVLFFSQEATTLYLICIALSLVLGSQRTEHEYRSL